MNAEQEESKKSIYSPRKKSIFRVAMYVFATANQLKNAYTAAKNLFRRIDEYFDYL